MMGFSKYKEVLIMWSFSNAINLNDTKLQFERFQNVINIIKKQGNRKVPLFFMRNDIFF